MSEERELIRALLGPAGPELTCEECFEQLDRYVELELAGGDADAEVPGMPPTSRAARPAARSTRACSPWPATPEPALPTLIPGLGRRLPPPGDAV